MEVTIGVANLPRELTIETETSADEVMRLLREALAADGVFELTDARGRLLAVPAKALGFVEIGPEAARRVGFGSL